MPSRRQVCCGKLSQKWIFAVMGFLASFCSFSMRMSLPLAIPIMVTPAVHSKQIIDDTCPGPSLNFSKFSLKNNSELIIDKGFTTFEMYDWSEYTQGIILGSFYYGFVASHIPGGILAEKYGGKHILGLGILGTAFFTIVTPFVIAWGGSTALIWMRVVMGLCEGVTQPAVSVLLAQWIPADQRSKISTFVFMGATLGILATSLGLGPIMRTTGWPGMFYVFGGISVIWYVMWSLLCYNSPREHPFISKIELEELNQKLGEHTHADAPPVPWKHLLKSGPFWALVAISVGRDWGGYTFMSDMPKYLMGVLKFTPEENGLLFLVGNVSILVSSTFFSWLADWLIVKDHMSTTNVRKIMVTLSMTVHGFFSVWTAYVGCNKLQYFILSFVSTFTSGAGFPGIKSNVLDLSPNYAGTVMAISHGLAGLCGIGAPFVVGVLAPNQTLTEWQLIFWIICAISIITNIIFVCFASGEVQEWNNPNFERKLKNKAKIEDPRESDNLLTANKITIVSAENKRVES